MTRMEGVDFSVGIADVDFEVVALYVLKDKLWLPGATTTATAREGLLCRRKAPD